MPLSIKSMASGPNVYTISPGKNFADYLVMGLLRRHGNDSLTLSRLTILLPNRRSIRAVCDGFMRQTAGKALLLPRMQAIGDIDEDEWLMNSLNGDDDLTVLPAITDLRRQLLLLNLIARNRGIEPALAAPLARELANFLDRLQTEEVALSALEHLVPDDLAAHWQETLVFLNILAEPWGELLRAEGCVDPSERRNTLLRAQANRWRKTPPEDPVVVAGSTGSIPATAELIEVVSHLPNGAVILPGLDMHSDEKTWMEIDQSHGQFGLSELLRRIGVERSQVSSWHGSIRETPRQSLIREAMRPTNSAEEWRDQQALFSKALSGLTRIDCSDLIEEAGIIALHMRQVLETPNLTAALITPDRGLARRVAVELKRWNILIDDSAGQPLAATAPGSFLRLTAEMFASDLDPIDLLATLKHPLALGCWQPGILHAAARDLDRIILRGLRPACGFEGLTAALASAPEKPDHAQKLLKELSERGNEVLSLYHSEQVALEEILVEHIRFSEWLATDEEGRCKLWSGEAGEVAMKFVSDLLKAAAGLPNISGDSYAPLFSSLMKGQFVRSSQGLHPRLHIWGPLEARLQSADQIYLGGLNEGSWPAAADTDPWLSRSMALKLGMPSSERRIGLAAHDFVQASSGGDVMLTRAEKVDGVPTVPSRWLLRLDQVLKSAGQNWHRKMPDTFRALHGQLDAAGSPKPVQAPVCKPPVAARPRRLSVTQVETWIRDPYSIYARHILNLRPLEPIAVDPNLADYGNVVHRALEQFVKRYPDKIPADAEAILFDLGRSAFGKMLNRTEVRAFWWPRFQRIVAWFLAEERGRRPDIKPVVVEVEGKLVLDGPAGSFELRGVADRVDRLADGSLCIIDYKTGVVPTESNLLRGEAPQLPLEAAIALRGGFAGVLAGEVSRLSYWRVSGGREPGQIKDIKTAGSELARRATKSLTNLIAKFDDPSTPYLAHPRPAIAPRFSDYDHLARIKEWSSGGPGDY